MGYHGQLSIYLGFRKQLKLVDFLSDFVCNYLKVVSNHQSLFFLLILFSQGINLDSADLSKLDLRFINFKMANLRKTDLAHANLSNCCLERANLSGAHMDVSGVKSDVNLFSPYNAP